MERESLDNGRRREQTSRHRDEKKKKEGKKKKNNKILIDRLENIGLSPISLRAKMCIFCVYLDGGGNVSIKFRN